MLNQFHELLYTYLEVMKFSFLKKIICRDYIFLVRESSEDPQAKNENSRFSWTYITYITYKRSEFYFVKNEINGDLTATRKQQFKS